MSVGASKTRESALTLGSDQEAAITHLVEHDATLLVAPMGAGKTAVVLRAIEEILADDPLVLRALVVAPLEVARATWPAEAAKWTELSMALAIGPEKARRAAMEGSEDVVVINFDNLAWAAREYDLPALFSLLVVDESTRLSSTGGVGFRRLRKHIPRFWWRVAMSGTPVAQGLDKLFGQMMIVDGGRTFGGSKERFLNTWFVPVDHERRRWEPHEMLRGEMIRRARPWAYTMPDYRGELPELELEHVWVDLPDEAREVYVEMARTSVLEGVTAANEAVLVGKLLQIAAGRVYEDEEEGGEARWVHDAKWKALDGVLDVIEGPCLIVYSYVWQREELERRGVPSFIGDLLQPWNEGKIHRMAIHPRSCGHGLNLQDGGADIVFLGPVWSRDQTDQVIGRLWRRGQTRPVHVRTLCARGTADEGVLARLEGHEAWHGMLLEGLGA